MIHTLWRLKILLAIRASDDRSFVEGKNLDKRRSNARGNHIHVPRPKDHENRDFLLVRYLDIPEEEQRQTRDPEICQCVDHTYGDVAGSFVVAFERTVVRLRLLVLKPIRRYRTTREEHTQDGDKSVDSNEGKRAAIKPCERVPRARFENSVIEYEDR